METARSAFALTVMVALSGPSLALFGSTVVEVTPAVLLIVPTVVAWRAIVTTALWPAVSTPMLQVIGPLPVHEPIVEVAELNVALEKLSLRVTPVAVDGPLLVTVTVNVTLALCSAGPEVVCETPTSACVTTAASCSLVGEAAGT